MIGVFTSNEYKNVIVDKLTYDQKSKEWARIANPRHRGITTNWVKNINDGKIYGGLPSISVGVYSPLSTLQKAYPEQFQGQPSNFTLSTAPNVTHK